MAALLRKAGKGVHASLKRASIRRKTLSDWEAREERPELSSWSEAWQTSSRDSSNHSATVPSLPHISGAGKAHGHKDSAHRSAASPHLSQPSAGRPAQNRRASQGPGSLGLAELKSVMLADAKVQDECIPIICDVLVETLRRNDATMRPPASALQGFEGDTSPVSAVSYVRRILKYSRCSTCCLVVGLMYLERLKTRQRDLRITSSNVQRLLLVAVMVAAKFFDDIYYCNRHWGQIGGITVAEINVLELDFLFCMAFDLGVTPDAYKQFLRSLMCDNDSLMCNNDNDEPASRSPAGVRTQSSPVDIRGSRLRGLCDNEANTPLALPSNQGNPGDGGRRENKKVSLPEIGTGSTIRTSGVGRASESSQ